MVLRFSRPESPSENLHINSKLRSSLIDSCMTWRRLGLPFTLVMKSWNMKFLWHCDRADPQFMWAMKTFYRTISRWDFTSRYSHQSCGTKCLREKLPCLSPWPKVCSFPHLTNFYDTASSYSLCKFSCFHAIVSHLFYFIGPNSYLAGCILYPSIVCTPQ